MKYIIKRLLGFVGKYRFPAILTIICMIGEVIFEVLIPKYMALLIDNGISLGDTGYVYRMGGVMILLTLGAMALGMLGVMLGTLLYAIFVMGSPSAAVKIALIALLIFITNPIGSHAIAKGAYRHGVRPEKPMEIDDLRRDFDE